MSQHLGSFATCYGMHHFAAAPDGCRLLGSTAICAPGLAGFVLISLQGVDMWRLTRAWPAVLVGLLVAPSCGGGSPTSPSTPWFQIKNCEIPTHGAMTADLDGTPWIPVSTRASGSTNITLDASDCTHALIISLYRFKGLGTYEVAGGDVFVDLRCDGNPCGVWKAGNGEALYGTNYGGSGSVTVTSYTAPTLRGEPSGAIEGTFSFTLVSLGNSGATGTRVITNGRFGSRFVGL